ncbi:Gfo/Idh/MocA family oxidoreductase [Nocardioides mesophilus]|uniref:Gfo/Idh/MocA family oxidoreductase n=1 Tax=Nocardioides mesophilus TaxID=433659 RepID=A0A7G9RFM9_9ACTN|nr:Gfo/Idh/MocA family oxidoreductase [Nocardioides mesophilus]QNN54404.1 Gfo/Idh/MocA family oxidoreductase [Nocardioides mesophilus]
MPPARATSLAMVGISHPHSSARFRSARTLGVDVVGAWDPDPVALQAFCEEVDTENCALEELLGGPAQGVLVHSKSKDMVSLAERALLADKAVLVEKPGGGDLEDLRHLDRLAQRPGAVVRVGYNFHYAPAMEWARSVLAQNPIGRVSLVRGHGASSRGEHLSAHLNQDADMGGSLWVIGCHVIHLMVDLLGRPEAVRATVTKLPGWSDGTSREDVAALTFLYEDRLATFDFTVHDNGEWFESSEMTLYGDEGQLCFGVLPARGQLLTLKGTDGLPPGRHDWRESSFAVPWTGDPSAFSELPQVGNRTFFDRELAEFVDAIGGSAARGVTARTALDVALVVAAAYESSRHDGQSVPLQPAAG